MAVQNVKDPFVLVQRAGDTYNGTSDPQTYALVPELIEAGDIITIVDASRESRIALPAGLTITESLVANNQTRLTLSNGAVIDIRGADRFTYSLAESLTPYAAGRDIDFTAFTEEVLSTTVPTQEVPENLDSVLDGMDDDDLSFDFDS